MPDLPSFLGCLFSFFFSTGCALIAMNLYLCAVPDLLSFLSSVFQFSFTLIVFCCVLIVLALNFMCRANYPVALLNGPDLPSFLGCAV